MLTAVVSMLAATAAHAAYEVADVKDAGSLTGLVRFTGALPTLAPLTVSRDRDVCGEQTPSEALVVGADGGVSGGVVRIEGVTKGKRRAGDVVLDSHRCVFVAHVNALAAGDKARVKNSDAILHNPHGILGKPTVFNVALPGREHTVDISRRLAKPGVVRVACAAHPHMSAWIVVHDSPYAAVTDERGAFRIDGIPPGTYKVTMWHEGFRARGVDGDGRPLYEAPRTISQDVTIAPNAAATMRFELK